jgi:hypothetical protein
MCAFKRAGGAQNEMILARRADNLQADRQTV